MTNHIIQNEQEHDSKTSWLLSAHTSVMNYGLSSLWIPKKLPVVGMLTNRSLLSTKKENIVQSVTTLRHNNNGSTSD